MTVVRVGNVTPKMSNGTPASHIIDDPCDGTITEFSMAPYYDDAEVAELALSTNNDRVLSMIGRGLATEDRRFILGVRDVEDAWWAAHSNDPPEWVQSDEDPEFARVLARHFSGGDHQCAVGRPDGWRAYGEEGD